MRQQVKTAMYISPKFFPDGKGLGVERKNEREALDKLSQARP
jgi:hypothetical protein